MVEEVLLDAEPLVHLLLQLRVVLLARRRDDLQHEVRQLALDPHPVAALAPEAVVAHHHHVRRELGRVVVLLVVQEHVDRGPVAVPLGQAVDDVERFDRCEVVIRAAGQEMFVPFRVMHLLCGGRCGRRRRRRGRQRRRADARRRRGLRVLPDD